MMFNISARGIRFSERYSGMVSLFFSGPIHCHSQLFSRKGEKEVAKKTQGEMRGKRGPFFVKSCQIFPSLCSFLQKQGNRSLTEAEEMHLRRANFPTVFQLLMEYIPSLGQIHYPAWSARDTYVYIRNQDKDK